MKKDYYRLFYAISFLTIVVIIGVSLRIYEVPMLGLPALFETITTQ
jgi:hypothetical protein